MAFSSLHFQNKFNISAGISSLTQQLHKIREFLEESQQEPTVVQIGVEYLENARGLTAITCTQKYLLHLKEAELRRLREEHKRAKIKWSAKEYELYLEITQLKLGVLEEAARLSQIDRSELWKHYNAARNLLRGIKKINKSCLRDCRLRLRHVIRAHFKRMSDCSGSDDVFSTVLENSLFTFKLNNHASSKRNQNLTNHNRRKARVLDARSNTDTGKACSPAYQYQ